MSRETVVCVECGEEYVVEMSGDQAHRAYRVRNWDKCCDDCHKKFLERERQEAITWSEEYGLPELEGTPAQVAWAAVIRRKLIEHTPLSAITGIGARAWGEVRKERSAAWWIDNRYGEWGETIRRYTVKLPTEHFGENALLAEAESTIRPANPVCELIAEIGSVGTTVHVRLPEKDEDFRKIVRMGLGFRWRNGRWEKTYSAFGGTIQDRMAELGHRLLDGGFIVRIMDPEIRRKAVAGEYAEETRRMVKKRTSGDYAGWFAIYWPFGEDFYKEAKRLPGAKYSKPDVVVPAEAFDEVLGFAEVNEFAFSPGAQELVEQARAARAASLVVEPAPLHPKTRPPSKDRPVLEPPAEVGIDPELKDEED